MGVTTRVFQLDIQWKTPLGIGQVHRKPTKGRLTLKTLRKRMPGGRIEPQY
jgi:hypothetical protein